MSDGRGPGGYVVPRAPRTPHVRSAFQAIGSSSSRPRCISATGRRLLDDRARLRGVQLPEAAGRPPRPARQVAVLVRVSTHPHSLLPPPPSHPHAHRSPPHPSSTAPPVSLYFPPSAEFTPSLPHTTHHAPRPSSPRDEEMWGTLLPRAATVCLRLCGPKAPKAPLRVLPLPPPLAPPSHDPPLAKAGSKTAYEVLPEDVASDTATPAVSAPLWLRWSCHCYERAGPLLSAGSVPLNLLL